MNIVKFLDKLEDKIRGFLSHYPIVYALLTGIGVVLFWRGVWHTADDIFAGKFNFMDGPISLIVGSIMLMLSGVFVSSFIGNEIIISGLKKEKKVTDKTEQEVMDEKNIILEIRKDLTEIKEKLNKKEEV